MSDEYLLRMENISKSFPGVHALNNVSFKVKAGEVHALIGENGAGKSTLMKVLNGIYHADSGTIRIDGKVVDIRNINDARNLGISFIHQEICLATNMTIAENIYLGVEPSKYNLFDRKTLNKNAQEKLDALNLNLKADTKVNALSIAQQQMVEIVKALSFNARILIMDEPTASLTEKETDDLFQQIEELKEKNVAIIYISHRLEETFQIADNFTVLRDGVYIGTKPVKGSSYDEIIEMMVGREIADIYTEKIEGKDVILQVKGLTNNYIRNVSFDLKRGEILGFSGLVGAGRTETARAIFGIDHIDSGEIYLEGKKVIHKHPIDSINSGIMLIPEDRRKCGLVLNNSIGFNITLTVLKKFIKFLKVDKKKENEIIDKYVNQLSIKISGHDQLTMNLSGGNQQKVIISKWLAAGPKILILDEPTRGIDVGAKSEIYRLMNHIAKNGVSIIMISSELPEIVNVSSRVAVMCEGSLTKILDPEEEEITQEKIMHYATGGK